MSKESEDEYNPMTSERRVRDVLIELQEADPTSKYNKMDASKAYGIIWRLWNKPAEVEKEMTDTPTDKDWLDEITSYIRLAKEVGIDVDGHIYAYIPDPVDGMGRHYDPTNIDITRLILKEIDRIKEDTKQQFIADCEDGKIPYFNSLVRERAGLTSSDTETKNAGLPHLG